MHLGKGGDEMLGDFPQVSGMKNLCGVILLSDLRV